VRRCVDPAPTDPQSENWPPLSRILCNGNIQREAFRLYVPYVPYVISRNSELSVKMVYECDYEDVVGREVSKDISNSKNSLAPTFRVKIYRLVEPLVVLWLHTTISPLKPLYEHI
jgi:hypothetical protein